VELIVEKLARESKVSEEEIKLMIETITTRLIYEGCPKDNPKFTQYLIKRLRTRLKIAESKTYQTFKQFFQR
jgi:hypothetical protein